MSSNFKIGGWHRIWIVLSILYLLLVVSLCASEFPKNLSDVSTYKVTALMDAKESKAITQTWESYESPNPSLSENEALVKLSNNQTIKISIPDWLNRAKPSDAKPVDLNKYAGRLTIGSSAPWGVSPAVLNFIDNIATDYENNIDKAYTKQRLEIIRYGFIAWIIPVIMVYLLGFSVSWIYKGFKNNR